MPHIAARDGTRLYYEEAGEGTAVVFVHEYAGDWRTWEPQMRFFSRAHRCVTYSQRGYPPSDVPKDGAQYSQDYRRDDVIAVMDALKIEKAHVVGHSMGAATALHVGIHYPQRCISVTAAGCGYGSSPDPKSRRGRCAPRRARPARCSRSRISPCGGALWRRRDAPDPEEQRPARLCRIHPDADRTFRARPRADDAESAGQAPDAVGHGSRFEEDFRCRCWCWSATKTTGASTAASICERTVPTAGLCIIPRSGHTITSEEPAAFNAAVAELIASAEAGRWMAHKNL